MRKSPPLLARVFFGRWVDAYLTPVLACAAAGSVLLPLASCFSSRCREWVRVAEEDNERAATRARADRARDTFLGAGFVVTSCRGTTGGFDLTGVSPGSGEVKVVVTVSDDFEHVYVEQTAADAWLNIKRVGERILINSDPDFRPRSAVQAALVPIARHALSVAQSAR